LQVKDSMKLYLLLSCTACSICSSWGTDNQLSKDESEKFSGQIRITRYQHNPLSAVPLQTGGTNSTGKPADAGTLLRAGTTTRTQVTIPEDPPLALQNEIRIFTTDEHKEFFKRKVAQIKLC